MVYFGETNLKPGLACFTKPNYGLVLGSTAAAEPEEEESGNSHAGLFSLNHDLAKCYV